MKLNNKTSIRQLNTEIEAALSTVCQKHGLRIETNGTTYDDDGTRCVTKLEILAPDESGEIITAEAKSFTAHCSLYDLAPEDLGKKFRHPRGDVYTVVGLNTRNSKFPVLCERQDGKGFKFTAKDVKQMLHFYNAD